MTYILRATLGCARCSSPRPQSPIPATTIRSWV